jgi:hypothetical protein
MNTLHLMERHDWQRWLAAHYQIEKEIWLVFYKRHIGKKRLEYEKARAYFESLTHDIAKTFKLPIEEVFLFDN